MAGFSGPTDAGGAGGLACEEGVESRLVLEQGGKAVGVTARAIRGRRFSQAPGQSLDPVGAGCRKHASDLTALLEPFRFIPDWRIDDLMIGYAPPAGSVGRMWTITTRSCCKGRGRRWQISHRPVESDNCLARYRVAHSARVRTGAGVGTGAGRSAVSATARRPLRGGAGDRV